MGDMTFCQFNLESCRLYKEDDGLYHRLAKHFGLSDSAFWIVYTLEAARRSLTQAEMSGYLNLSKQTINSGIKSLEQAGYIRPTGGPGRKKYLELTQAGQALAERTAEHGAAGFSGHVPHRAGRLVDPDPAPPGAAASGGGADFSTTTGGINFHGNQII